LTAERVRPARRARAPFGAFARAWVAAALLACLAPAALAATPREEVAPPGEPLPAVAASRPGPSRPGPIPTAALSAVAVLQAQDSAPADTAFQAPQRAGEIAARARAEMRTPLHERLLSVFGTGLLVLLGWLLSENRRRVDWRIVAWGIGLQFVFALLVLKTGPGRVFFEVVNDAFVRLLGFTQEGARFLFGNLVESNVPVGTPAGEPPQSAPIPPASVTGWANVGAFFAFSVLPTIIFFSSLMTLLYYVGVLQPVVRFFARVMQRTMRTSGAETLAASANIFVGQTEAPLMVKPYVRTMTRSELMCLMAAGFANTAGGVMAAYVALLSPHFPGIAGHLLAASIMSAPAAIAFSKLMLPETEEPVTRGTVRVEVESPDVNALDATTRGASEGLALAFNVGAMLLAFIALIAFGNAILGWAGGLVGLEGLTLQRLLGWALAPLAFAMGVPWADAAEVGSLLGIKTAVNEFVAYLQLAGDLEAGTGLSPRSIVIATYALSGFANFSSIAIQIGGIGGIAPERRHDLSRLGLRAMIAGSFASFQTATIAGMLI
jgi:CNT family concentrative nucleoside transporter